MNGEHRCAQPDARNLGLLRPLIAAGVPGNIGRGSPHVEANQTLIASRLRGLDHPDDTARRSRQDRILAPKCRGGDQTTTGLHEQQPRPPQLAAYLINVAPQHRRQIGIDHRGITARDQLDQPGHIVADRELREPDLARDCRQYRFVRRITVGVHQHDGDGAQPSRIGRCHGLSCTGGVNAPENLPLGTDPFINLDHVLIERCWQFDLPVEQFGACLIADAQRVAKPARDRQQDRLPPPLQQGVGGNSCPHFDSVDCGIRITDDRPNAGNRSVPISFRVLRQQLPHDQLSGR